MINYFKSAERVLSERGNLDRAHSNLERRLERAIVRHGPSDLPAIDYSRPYVSASTTADALSDCLEVAEITREINTTKETIQEIDRVLEQLSPDDASLLRAWYVEREPKEEIAERLAYSSRTSVYDLRNKAVSSFAILYFGAGAISST